MPHERVVESHGGSARSPPLGSERRRRLGRTATNDLAGSPGGSSTTTRLGRALDAGAGRIARSRSTNGRRQRLLTARDRRSPRWRSAGLRRPRSDLADDRLRHSSDRKSHRRQLKWRTPPPPRGVPLFARVVNGARHDGARGELLETSAAWRNPDGCYWCGQPVVNKASPGTRTQPAIRFVSRLAAHRPTTRPMAQPWRPLSICCMEASGPARPDSGRDHRNGRPRQRRPALPGSLHATRSEDAGTSQPAMPPASPWPSLRRTASPAKTPNVSGGGFVPEPCAYGCEPRSHADKAPNTSPCAGGDSALAETHHRDTMAITLSPADCSADRLRPSIKTRPSPGG